MFEYKATIENVVDGDTVDALIDLGFKVYIKQRLRLSGLDTPERGQPGYAEAKAFVTEKVLGKVVSIKTEKVSKWGYFLAEITVDGVSLNTQLLSSGLAKAYDGGKKEWKEKLVRYPDKPPPGWPFPTWLGQPLPQPPPSPFKTQPQAKVETPPAPLAPF